MTVEPTWYPKLTRCMFRYDFYSDMDRMAPLLPMCTIDVHDRPQFVSAKIHAGGLRYPGAGAVVSQLLKDKLIEAETIDQLKAYEVFEGVGGLRERGIG